jgi:Fe(3+) dicitrate transport protein
MKTRFKNYKQQLIGFLTLVSFFTSPIAQEISITGQVLDAVDNDPLVGASVLLKNGKGVSTDLNGEYNLKLNPGDYELTFKYIGYSSKYKKNYFK